ELADELGVAIGTVTRAYAVAEQRGLIHGEGRRGTFVGESRGGKSALASLTEAKPKLIDLSINYPIYSVDPDLRFALRQLARKTDLQQLLMYPPAEGHPRHRAAGAAWIRTMGLQADPENVVVTAGAQHALTVVLASLTAAGETILTEALTYPGIKAVADLLGLRLIGVPMDRDGLQPAALDSLCRKWKPRALYSIPTLHNPTNVTLSESRRLEIVALAKKHDLHIIEDEIHRRLVSKAPPLLASLAPDRTVLIASPSKVVAGGLRTGFIAVPPRYCRNVVDTLQAISIAVPPLPAEVLSLWIENGTAEKVVARRKREAKARQRLVAKILGGFAISAPAVSYYVWMNLPEPWTRMEFTMQAQRRGVAVAPADTFFVGDTNIPEAIRISLGTPENREVLKTGLLILADILGSAPGYDSTAM
ncbi:MAG: aminotransferase-like domain-containing protein, partial [Planctomycetota bacterium]